MKLLASMVIAIVCVGLCTCLSSGQKGEDSMWTLIWSDEFKRDEIDRLKWTFDIGNGFWFHDEWVSGWGNEELEYYTDRGENAFIENGMLVIRAVKESYEGCSYTSARLKTEGLFGKLYGKFEFRARFPAGKGFWPAIWMEPEIHQYGSWAASGEIDIVEGRGSNPSEVSSAIHFGAEWPDNKHTGETYLFPEGESASDFHIYTLEWEPGELRFYVDGNNYATLNRWYTRRGTYPAPFNKKFYIKINLAVGGHFDGNPTEATVFPGLMHIDYVRVYELTGSEYRFPEKPPEKIPPEPRPDQARPALEDGNEIYNTTFTLDEPAGDMPMTRDNAGIPGTAYWFFLHLPEFGGEGTLSIEKIDNDNYARIDILEPGIQPYSVQLIQRVPLIKGHKYRASFRAKASGMRVIQFKINGDEDNSWVTYSKAESVHLTPELKGYEYTFVMEQKTDTEARYEFNVGLDSHSVWIGHIRLDDITDYGDYKMSPYGNRSIINVGRYFVQFIDLDPYPVYNQPVDPDSYTGYFLIDSALEEYPGSLIIQ
ncbi:MAG: family 16 glycosylhydrolase [Spirochaetales bacterium]|nr:family 16 glycosylhydrolase [Spirochaetales bacterium]